MAADMLTNLVRDLDDHDLSVLHTRNTQIGLVPVPDNVNTRIGAMHRARLGARPGSLEVGHM